MSYTDFRDSSKTDMVSKLLMEKLSLFQTQEKIRDFFLGGSTRFGWATHTSDVDVFVLADLRLSHIKELDLSPTPSRIAYQLGWPHYQTFINGIKIDFLVTFDEETFHALRIEHMAIERLLASNPGFLVLIKGNKMRGPKLYRTLASIVNIKEHETPIP